MSDGSDSQLILSQGQRAFECGQYQSAIGCFEQGRTTVSAGTALHGEFQIWLVTAYEAAGDRTRALDLCRAIGSHPDLETRKQSKRLLYILEAPKLRMNPECLTEIPDLTQIEPNGGDRDWGRPVVNLTPPRPPKLKPPTGYVIPEPPDLTQVNTGDDRSILWAAFAAISVFLGVLWASR